MWAYLIVLPIPIFFFFGHDIHLVVDVSQHSFNRKGHLSFSLPPSFPPFPTPNRTAALT